MNKIVILAASVFCMFSAKADDDYATIVRYLGENGHYIIAPDDVAKVRAFMKANGYQHVSEIPKGPQPAVDSVSRSAATVAAPVTQVVVPSAIADSKAGQSVPPTQLTYSYQVTKIARDSAGFNIEGTIQNISPHPIAEITVNGVGYNRNHEILKEGFDFPVVSHPLEPNQIVHFEVSILDFHQEIESYSLSLDVR